MDNFRKTKTHASSRTSESTCHQSAGQFDQGIKSWNLQVSSLFFWFFFLFFFHSFWDLFVIGCIFGLVYYSYFLSENLFWLFVNTNGKIRSLGMNIDANLCVSLYGYLSGCIDFSFCFCKSLKNLSVIPPVEICWACFGFLIKLLVHLRIHLWQNLCLQNGQMRSTVCTLNPWKHHLLTNYITPQIFFVGASIKITYQILHQVGKYNAHLLARFENDEISVILNAFLLLSTSFFLSSFQFKVLRRGGWLRINFQRPDLKLHKAYESAGKSQTVLSMGAVALAGPENRATNSSGNKAVSCYLCHHDMLGSCTGSFSYFQIFRQWLSDMIHLVL